MTDDRNPYVTADGPKLRLSVFVFMDLLGYSEYAKFSEPSDQNQEKLIRLHTALSEGRANLEGKYASDFARSFSKKDYFALKAFSDNIVIGWPIHEDAEPEIGSALFKIAFFQFEMAMRGFFVRGAISIGDAYIDDITVFGGALIEAYQGEASLARDPRIILTNSAVSAVKGHLRYYGDGRFAPHVKDILCDSDGQWFVNYLDTVFIAGEERGPFYEEFLKHKQAVEENLTAFRGNPAIFSKYVWAARYHNYFCDLHSRFFSEEHRVPSTLFESPPRSILDD